MNPQKTSKTLASLLKFFSNIADEKYFDGMYDQALGQNVSDGFGYIKSSARILKSRGFKKPEAFICLGVLNSFLDSPLNYERIQHLTDDVWDEVSDKKELAKITLDYNPVHIVGHWTFNDWTGIISYKQRNLLRLSNGSRAYRLTRHMFENGNASKSCHDLFEQLLAEERDESERSGTVLKTPASLRDYALRKDSRTGRILDKLFKRTDGTNAEISFDMGWSPSEEDFDNSLAPS